MRDLDEQSRPLGERAAVEVDGTELRHDPVDVAPRRHDPGPGRQLRHDPRHRAPLRRRGQRDDRLALAAHRGAADEVHLAADARMDPVPERVGTHLPGEVDLEGRVDRDHPIDLADRQRVVRAVARMELHERVVVHEVEDASRARHEARDDAPRVDRLEAVADHAGLDERHDAVGEHLGVDPEIVPVAEPREHGVGDAADPQLQARPVDHEVGHVPGDAVLHLARRPRRPLVQWPIGRGARRHPRPRHRRRPVRARHPRVDLGEDERCGVDRRASRVHRGAQRAEAVAVGGGQLHDRRVEPHASAREESGDVGEENRYEVGPPLGDGVAQVCAGEERHRTEAAGTCGLGPWRRPLEVEVPERDVLEIVPPRERLEKRRGRGRGAVDEDVHPAPDVRNDRVGTLGAVDHAGPVVMDRPETGRWMPRRIRRPPPGRRGRPRR